MEKPLKLPKEALPYIEFLESELKKFTESPYSGSFLAISIQQDDFNNQLQTKSIDLFADKESKEFDRAKWYMENILDISNTRAELYKKLTPEETKEADSKLSEIRIKKKQRIGIAEQLAVNGAK